MYGTRRLQHGFTLIEMIMVILLTAILGTVVALIIGWPVQGYVDTTRRDGMGDAADTAVSRITRDMRAALPNSVRITTVGSVYYLEFIPVAGGGRYRANATGGAGACGVAGDDLSFLAADTCFEVLGAMPVFAAGESIVVNNLGTAGNSAYDVPATNRTSWVSNTATAVTIGSFLFPAASPGNRFQVISTPVTYVCTPVPGGSGGALRRYWGYAIQAAQPNSTAVAPLSTASNALLASNVSSCSFSLPKSNLVSIQLGITNSGETINIYNEAHVANAP